MTKLTPVRTIRLMTGIIDPNISVALLCKINLLARWLDKDPNLDREFLLGVFREHEIELDLEDR
jgi:hypothetical protein